MITRDIRRYVARNWQEVRDSKDEYWANRIRQIGCREGFRVAEELRLQAIRQNPGWPTEEDRETDLTAHVRLTELLRSVPYTGGR